MTPIYRCAFGCDYDTDVLGEIDEHYNSLHNTTPAGETLTDIKEIANSLSKAIRDTKMDSAKADPEDCQLNIYMHVMRGNHSADTILIGFDRDKSLHALNIAAAGMDADYISLSYEGWVCEQEINPDTGEGWGEGEMHEYVQKHGKDGVVGEGITTYVVDRNQEVAFRAQPYTQHGPEIEWHDDRAEAVTGAGGYIPETLKRIMAQPKFTDLIPEVMKAMGDDLGEERRLFHQDMAILRAISEQELIFGASLMAEKGSLREQLIRERFEEENEG